MGSVVGIIMSLMVLEHIPRIVEVARFSGDRSFIVGQTLLGLLPEYGGIGVLVGLYLSFALAIRKLELRGELAVIEAAGIGPWRWMRMPIVLTVLGAGFILVNQGWLVPRGEQKIALLGQRMARGNFGYLLSAGEFHQLGARTTIRFDGIDPSDHSLTDVMLLVEERVYNARRAQLSIAPSGEGLLQLSDGQALDREGGHILTFEELAFRMNGGRARALDEMAFGPLDRTRTLDELWRSGEPPLRAAAHARLLWVPLALLVPALAFAVGRPAMRSASPIGLVFGLCLLVAFLKSISLVETASWAASSSSALVLLATWIGIVGFLIEWQRRSGIGALDMKAALVFRRLMLWIRPESAPSSALGTAQSSRLSGC